MYAAAAYARGTHAAQAAFGLTKEARVPTAVKMYRRAATGFEEASRAIPRGDPHGRTDGGFGLHGSGAVPSILESKRIIASPVGETGQHGSGAYFWKGFPREEYLQGVQNEGILTDLKTLPNRRPMTRNIYGEHFNLHSAVSGPADYRLRPKDTAVIDTNTRVKNKTLDPMLGDAAEAKSRVIDSAIFQRARQQARENNRVRVQSDTVANPSIKNPNFVTVPTSPVRLKSPTKDELVGLLRSRSRGQGPDVI